MSGRIGQVRYCHSCKRSSQVCVCQPADNRTYRTVEPPWLELAEGCWFAWVAIGWWTDADWMVD